MRLVCQCALVNLVKSALKDGLLSGTFIHQSATLDFREGSPSVPQGQRPGRWQRFLAWCEGPYHQGKGWDLGPGCGFDVVR